MRRYTIISRCAGNVVAVVVIGVVEHCVDLSATRARERPTAPCVDIADRHRQPPAGFELSTLHLQRLAILLNAAARLVYSRRRSEHTTPLLQELHWLRVPERIQFRLPVVCSGVPLCARHSTGVPVRQLRPTSEIVARRCLRSADTTTLQVRSTSLYPLIPRLQNSQHHCHLHSSL